MDKAKRKKQGVAGTQIGELEKVSDFKDIIVLQKRFLPKTKRLELSLGLQTNFDNPYEVDGGPVLRVAGYFLEPHGIELSAGMFSRWDRQLGKDIEQMEISGIIYRIDNYFGVAYKWQPIYGKMAWFDKKNNSF